jgi:hypothetical protein
MNKPTVNPAYEKHVLKVLDKLKENMYKITLNDLKILNRIINK